MSQKIEIELSEIPMLLALLESYGDMRSEINPESGALENSYYPVNRYAAKLLKECEDILK